jgi:rhodanese-related sulfurtransferase
MNSTTDASWIDVREYPEFASGHIEGSRLVPLGRLEETSSAWERTAPLTLVCKSGIRAHEARQRLSGLGFTSLTVLEGGIDQWRLDGKPLVTSTRKPWSIERQVRITAGSLVLVTLALAYFSSRFFLLGTTFVGAGLVYAGVSDTCMMGLLLARLPWNQPARTDTP